MSSYTDEDKNAQPHFELKTWKKLAPFLKPQAKKLIAICFFMIIMAGIDIAMPLFQRYAIDHFIISATTDGLWGFSAIYAATIILQGVIVIYAFGYLSMSVEMNMSKSLKRAAFIHLQKLSFSYYNQTPVGYILARVMSDTNKISSLMAWNMVDLLWAAVYIIGVFIAMLSLNVTMALWVMAIVPVIAIITVMFEGKILKVNRKMRMTNSRITGAYNEGITGAKTSKTLVIEDKNCADFQNVTTDMYHASMGSTMLNAMFIPIVVFFGSLAVAIVLVKGGYLAMSDMSQFGVLSAFIAYALGILEPVQQAARVAAEFISTQVNIERVFGLLERECDIVDSPDVVAKYGDCFDPKSENWEKLHGDIEFEHVWFKYPDGDEYILEDFNLKIPAGTNVAIVGETGAGKSTLVNLACRFFEPTKGRILIDGRDYKERSQLWLHSGIGYVLQNPHLFSGTVLENIRYGKLNATKDEIEAACRLVSADTVVAKLESGFDTDVGEGGSRLSTGEKQLVSFARAVLCDPAIFVLDEATSSIDTETEQLIQQAISHILKNRTSFLIAHRLSTVRHADLILVVRDGKIIERGTHDELIAQKGYYCSLYTSMLIREEE